MCVSSQRRPGYNWCCGVLSVVSSGGKKCTSKSKVGTFGPVVSA